MAGCVVHHFLRKVVTLKEIYMLWKVIQLHKLQRVVKHDLICFCCGIKSLYAAHCAHLNTGCTWPVEMKRKHKHHWKLSLGTHTLQHPWPPRAPPSLNGKALGILGWRSRPGVAAHRTAPAPSGQSPISSMSEGYTMKENQPWPPN